MSFYKSIAISFLFVLLLSLSSVAAPPNETPFTISGFITDEDGGSVSGVLVTVTNMGSGESVQSISDGTGYYGAVLMDGINANDRIVVDIFSNGIYYVTEHTLTPEESEGAGAMIDIVLGEQPTTTVPPPATPPETTDPQTTTLPPTSGSPDLDISSTVPPTTELPPTTIPSLSETPTSIPATILVPSETSSPTQAPSTYEPCASCQGNSRGIGYYMSYIVLFAVIVLIIGVLIKIIK